MNDDFISDLKLIALLGVAFGLVIVWLGERKPSGRTLAEFGRGCAILFGVFYLFMWLVSGEVGLAYVLPTGGLPSEMMEGRR